MTQCISALATCAPAGAAIFGQSASTSSVSRGALLVRAQSSSVMKGIKGCNSLRISSLAQAVVARVSALAASLPDWKTGLVISTYQSQNWFQMKR